MQTPNRDDCRSVDKEFVNYGGIKKKLSGVLMMDRRDENQNSIGTLGSNNDERNMNDIHNLNFEFTERTNLNLLFNSNKKHIRNPSNNFYNEKLKIFDGSISEIENFPYPQYASNTEVNFLKTENKYDTNKDFIETNETGINLVREKSDKMSNMDYENYIKNNFGNSNTLESEQLKEIREFELKNKLNFLPISSNSSNKFKVEEQIDHQEYQINYHAYNYSKNENTIEENDIPSENYDKILNFSNSPRNLIINPNLNSYSFTRNQTPNFYYSKGKIPLSNTYRKNRAKDEELYDNYNKIHNKNLRSCNDENFKKQIDLDMPKVNVRIGNQSNKSSNKMSISSNDYNYYFKKAFKKDEFNNLYGKKKLDSIKEQETLSQISNIDCEINNKRNDSKNFTLNNDDNMLITLKPEEYVDTIENKLDYTGVSFNNSTKNQNKNRNRNLTDDVYNMPLQQKSKIIVKETTEINNSFLKNIETKFIKKPVITEKFFELEKKPLAVFFSAKNNISDNLNDRSKLSENTIDRGGNINLGTFANISINQNYIYNNDNNINNNFYETFNSIREIIDIDNNTYYSSNTDKRIKTTFNRSIRSKKISFDAQNSQNYIPQEKLQKRLDSMKKYHLGNESYMTYRSEIDIYNTEAYKEIHSFLKPMNLEDYSMNLIKHGFDDLDLLISQMKTESAINDMNLKDIGINLPGDRARILIKIEDKSKSFSFDIPQNTYYSAGEIQKIKTAEILNDNYFTGIFKWLQTMKLEKYTRNFIINGYHSIELIFLQMISKNPITEKILDEELQIDKLGYRIRILNKLKEDSRQYSEKLKNSTCVTNGKNDPIHESCKCNIF